MLAPASNPRRRLRSSVESLEARCFLTATPDFALGTLGLGADLNYRVGNGETSYHFTLSSPTTLSATLYGTLNSPSDRLAMLYRNGKVLASGSTISRSVLGSGRYKLVTPFGETGTLALKTSTTAAPTRVEATVWGSNAIRLNWDPESQDTVGYRIDRWTKTGWRNSKVYAAAGDTAAVIENLLPNAATSYRIVALNIDGGAARSVNTVSATTQRVSTVGWYKVKLTQGMTKGEASWAMLEDNMKMRPEWVASGGWSTWVNAGSWQQAVGVVIASLDATGANPRPVKVAVTNNNAPGYPQGSYVQHKFPTGGDFAVGKYSELKAQVEGNQSGMTFDITGVGDSQKLIVIEDTYGATDRDYDDWFWKVDVIGVQPPKLEFQATTFIKQNYIQ